MTAPTARAKTKREEDAIQRSILGYLAAVAPQCFVFAVPNGGYRTKAEAAILKGLGVRAGVPDLCLLMPGGRAYFIEVKASKGELEASQREVIEIFVRMDQPYAVCRSIEDVRKSLAHWKISTREATPS